MKLFLILLHLGLMSQPPPNMLLVDRNFKKPPSLSKEFTLELYFQKFFPVYIDDVAAVTDGAEKTAKRIYHGNGCSTYDTIAANHSYFIIHTSCEGSKSVSVRLVTKVDEVFIDFVLAKEDDTIRKVQQKLLDFATYLKNK